MNVLIMLGYSILCVSLVPIFLLITSSEASDCESLCRDGRNSVSSECYAVVECDFSFPNVRYSDDSQIELFRVELSFTELLPTDDTRSEGTFLFSELFWLEEDLRRNDYKFRVEYLPKENPLHIFEFSFSILNLQPEQAGTYHVSLYHAVYIYDGVDRLLLQHSYRLFTVYPPPSPLLCQSNNLTLVQNSHYDFELRCSITNAYPIIDLDIIEPNNCVLGKRYSRDGDIQEYTVFVTSCSNDSTVSCVATQQQLGFTSIKSYEGRCSWGIPKSRQSKSVFSPLMLLLKVDITFKSFLLVLMKSFITIG